MRAVLVIALLSLIPVAAGGGPVVPATASPVSYTLWGRASRGWGFTSDTITTPGPSLTALPGESVVMSLYGADNPPHTFWVDYDGDGTIDAGEPLSPEFSGPSGITYSFTATSTSATYTYYCSVHPTSMFGSFTVAAPEVHNVAAIGITASRYFAYSGVSSNPVQVNVTAENKGSSSETFFTAAIANAVVIGNQSVTVPAGGKVTVMFSWHPELLATGTYQLTGRASVVPGESSTADNSIIGAVFAVRFKGDVDESCSVNIVDLATVGASFGATSTSPGFNPNADMNNDMTVNIVDLATVGSVFGRTC